MFLKDGILYFNPLKEPLNAFDTSLFGEKHLLNQAKNIQWSNKTNESSVDDSSLQFDSTWINAKQFANLIRNFLGKNLLDSEIYVNDLISFLRENYQETSNEKSEKLEHVNIYHFI